MYYDRDSVIDHNGDEAYYNPTNSHYMTIIGYSKYHDFNTKNDKYILKIVSWGSIYYVDYDEFKKQLGVFTNILEIE